MNKLNFENFLNLDWETTIYRKGNSLLSVGYVKNSNKKKIIYMSPNKKFVDKTIINELELIELKELPAKYIINS